MADPQHRVVISGIDISFGALVAFFVKATLAAIPAAIIVWIIVTAIWFLVGAMFGMSFRPRPAW